MYSMSVLAIGNMCRLQDKKEVKTQADRRETVARLNWFIAL